MTKRGILNGSSLSAPPPDLPDPPAKRGKRGGTKPIPAIGTMQRDATPQQHKAHHMLKMRLKRMAADARRARGLSQEDGAGKA